MKIIAFIRDPVGVQKILEHLDMLTSSCNDPPGPPDFEHHCEPVYDDLTPSDPLLPDD